MGDDAIDVAHCAASQTLALADGETPCAGDRAHESGSQTTAAEKTLGRRDRGDFRGRSTVRRKEDRSAL